MKTIITSNLKAPERVREKAPFWKLSGTILEVKGGHISIKQWKTKHKKKEDENEKNMKRKQSEFPVHGRLRLTQIEPIAFFLVDIERSDVIPFGIAMDHMRPTHGWMDMISLFVIQFESCDVTQQLNIGGPGVVVPGLQETSGATLIVLQTENIWTIHSYTNIYIIIYICNSKK